MKPGQVAVQVGELVGFPVGGPSLRSGLSLQTAVSKRASVGVGSGVLRETEGDWLLLDTRVGVSVQAVSTPELVVQLTPGFTLPTGSVGAGFYYTEVSTASVDPTLSVDIVGGGAWVGIGQFYARVPLYDGSDLRRQGPYLSADGRLGRRLDKIVPFVGLGAVRQMPSDPVGAAADFTEFYTHLGGVVNLADKWSATGTVRVPLWSTDGAIYRVAVGASLKTVFGKGLQDPE